MCTIQDLPKPCGTANIAGVAPRLYMVPAEDIDTFPGFVDDGTPAGAVTLDGEIVLKAGKKFFVVDMATDSGEVKDMAVGPIDGKSIQSELDYQTPGGDADVIGHQQCTLNACLVVIARTKDGHLRVFGNLENPAKIESSESTSGKSAEDLRAVTYKLKSTTGKVAPFYTGTIDLDDTP